MPDKKFVCKKDGRSFASAKTLAQHVKDAHPSGAMASGSKARKGSMAPRVGKAASVSQPSMVRAVSTDMARLSGTDRLASVDLTTKTLARTSLTDLVIRATSFKRLKAVASAYQRIKFTKLNFRVEPQMSTATSGGYVAAFIPDPADDIGSLEALTAQHGSVTTKWWQSSVVRAANIGRLLYTSESKEIREFSPGRMVLWSDGAPTQNGNVTIFAEWTVELSGASFEEETRYTQTFLVRNTWYAVSGQENICTKDKDGKNTFAVSSLIQPAPPVGAIFRLPYSVVATEVDGTNNTIHNAHWAYVKSDKELVLCYASPTDLNSKFGADDTLVIKGEVLEYTNPPSSVQGEAMAPSSSDSQTTTAALGTDLMPSLVQSVQQLTELLRQLQPLQRS